MPGSDGVSRVSRSRVIPGGCFPDAVYFCAAIETTIILDEVVQNGKAMTPDDDLGALWAACILVAGKRNITEIHIAKSLGETYLTRAL